MEGNDMSTEDRKSEIGKGSAEAGHSGASNAAGQVSRRDFLRLGALAGTGALFGRFTQSTGDNAASFDIEKGVLEEATIADLQAAMESGQLTAVELTLRYLACIERIDKHGPGL